MNRNLQIEPWPPMGQERCPSWFEPFSFLAKMFWLSHRQSVQMHTHELQPHITANYRNQMLSPVFGQRAQKSKSKTLSAGVAAEHPSTAQHDSSSGKQGDDPLWLPAPGSLAPGKTCVTVLTPVHRAWPCCSPVAVLAPSRGQHSLREAVDGSRTPLGGQQVSLACGKLCGDGTTPTCWC